ncbi:MAG: zinc-binding alcohol dehydrogenase family protein [Pirellulales bacterium]
MQALQLKQPREFQRIDVPEPAHPGPGEALVRVHRVGICGTDIAGYLGKMPFYSYPRIPGHELGVEVVDVGADVTNVKRGERCSVEPYINCQNCFACHRGAGNCCLHLQVLGVHIDGGLRPQFILPARKLHPSTQLTFEQLALVETLAIGCHAVNRGNPQRGEWVLLVGAGPIGLATLEFIRLSGARPIVLDMNAARLEFCGRTYEVEHTVLAKGDGSELAAVEEITGGNFATVVFDATGSPQSMSNSFNYVGHTGKLVFVGIVNSDVSFFDPLLHRREMMVLASRNALPSDFTRIIGLIEAGQIDTRPWITHRTPFDRLIEDFPSFTRPETGVVKAVVEL